MSVSGSSGRSINPLWSAPMAPRYGTPPDLMLVRQRWAHVLAVAGVIECRRCHRPIRPGEEWDLGHPADKPYANGNRDDGLAPEHTSCNRRGIVTDEPTFSGWGTP